MRSLHGWCKVQKNELNKVSEYYIDVPKMQDDFGDIKLSIFSNIATAILDFPLLKVITLIAFTSFLG